MAIRIYMDACCLNRPFDDQSQVRVRLESEAVQVILRRVVEGELTLISSTLVVHEVMQGRDSKRQIGVLKMLSMASETILPNNGHSAEALRLTKEVGLTSYDALHIVLARASGAHVFLTVDDGIIKKAGGRFADGPRIANPLDWANQNL